MQCGSCDSYIFYLKDTFYMLLVLANHLMALYR